MKVLRNDNLCLYFCLRFFSFYYINPLLPLLLFFISFHFLFICLLFPFFSINLFISFFSIPFPAPITLNQHHLACNMNTTDHLDQWVTCTDTSTDSDATADHMASTADNSSTPARARPSETDTGPRPADVNPLQQALDGLRATIEASNKNTAELKQEINAHRELLKQTLAPAKQTLPKLTAEQNYVT